MLNVWQPTVSMMLTVHNSTMHNTETNSVCTPCPACNPQALQHRVEDVIKYISAVPCRLATTS
jgi:hypothetical protein